jgi:hypothetical protein
MPFLRWARAEGYAVDPRLLELKRPRVPNKEPTVYHIAQLQQILAACNPRLPQEALAVRLLGGYGSRSCVDWLWWRLTGSPTWSWTPLSGGGWSSACAGTVGQGPRVTSGADHAQAGSGD